MISSQDHRSPITLEKDLVADQTLIGLQKKTNVTNLAFDATKGLGYNNASTSSFVPNLGGIPDVKITARVSFGSATLAAAADIGVMVRNSTMDTPINGYYARMVGGAIRISKATSGSFTTLTSGTMACAQDDVMEITLSASGDLLTATFENQTANPGVVTTLTATDSTYTTGSCVVRSLTSSFWCRYFKVEQL